MFRTSYRKACFIFAVFFSILRFSAFCAEPESSASHEISFTMQNTDSGKKHYIGALGGVLAVNTVISSWNRFVSKADWAQVTWDDAIHFYEHDQSWDTDWYWTNFVLHPYQGSLYYMGARGCNLNQFESFLVSVLGSCAWEYFYETNAPSKNDLIYTPIGGFAVGEMLYRLSLEADSVNKICGYLLNPMRPYSEFVTGERNRGSTGHIHELSVKLSAGTTKAYTFFTGSNAPDTDSTLYPVFVSPEFSVVYNDPYGWDSNDPYGQFELTMGGAIGPGSGRTSGSSDTVMYDVHIISSGMLFSRAPDLGENKDTTVGIVFDYDFIFHSYMELSTLSPGFAVKQRIKYDTSTVEWQYHLDYLLLGTSDYYYIMHDVVPETETRREYSFNTGVQSLFLLKRTGSSGQVLDTGVRFYAMWDFPDQVQNDAKGGWDFVWLPYINYEIPVSNRVHIGLGNSLYLKKGIYYGMPDIFQTVYTGTVFARLKTGK
jgi:hypothetical protein